MSKLIDLSVSSYVLAASSNSPTPGGGSVAALTGALGCAMASMVANFTIGKKKYADFSSECEAILQKSQEYQNKMLAAVDEDAAVFSLISAAYKLPKSTEEEQASRSEAIESALKSAATIPTHLLDYILAFTEFLPKLAKHGNSNLVSDAAVSACLLEAAAKSACFNIAVNLSQLSSEEDKKQLHDIRIHLDRIKSYCQETLLIAEERILQK